MKNSIYTLGSLVLTLQSFATASLLPASPQLAPIPQLPIAPAPTIPLCQERVYFLGNKFGSFGSPQQNVLDSKGRLLSANTPTLYSCPIKTTHSQFGTNYSYFETGTGNCWAAQLMSVTADTGAFVSSQGYSATTAQNGNWDMNFLFMAVGGLFGQQSDPNNYINNTFDLYPFSGVGSFPTEHSIWLFTASTYTDSSGNKTTKDFYSFPLAYQYVEDVFNTDFISVYSNSKNGTNSLTNTLVAQASQGVLGGIYSSGSGQTLFQYVANTQAAGYFQKCSLSGSGLQ